MKQLNTQPAKTAVVYLRARTMCGDDYFVDAQLEWQRAACQEVAEYYGAHIVHEYAAIGGTRTGHVRHIVSIMLDAVSRDHVDYVIAAGIDRFCRGSEAERQLLSSIHRSGARLLVGNTFDPEAYNAEVPVRLVDDVVRTARSPRMHRTAGRRSA